MEKVNELWEDFVASTSSPIYYGTVLLRSIFSPSHQLRVSIENPTVYYDTRN